MTTISSDTQPTTLILGTRGSRLALVQSEMIATALRAAHPGLAVELRVISTKGDRILDRALSAVGDKGLFVKELEQALLAGEVDLCVHSCKDLPSLVPDGLVLAAFPPRADARDMLVLRAASDSVHGNLTLAALRHGAVVGTSSLRRAAQLRACRPDLELRDVRGNVDTRLRKLADVQYDALILAAAGLDRLGLVGDGDRVESDGARFQAMRISIDTMLPAVAQGVLAIECRADDALTIAMLAVLDDQSARAMALAERAFLRRLEGGCQVPIAAHSSLEGRSLLLRGLVSSLDGADTVHGRLLGDPAAPETIGLALAEELLARGAATILAELATHE